ncbi:protein-glutamate methylesterase [Mycolicibacterium novocastrense]|uniref:chemotaxis protein CheB n=1 Tax=Mycolicibacterium novocastrense TaxID=59813 RepID=UPI000747AB4A|nr:chemotaxis protein CheB [Mycolicibacterium novocastrense]KUH70147.1 protein-glutamate methylesterase [Mycolicibacterium novocastrense]KUH78437.1 protein-glutamate methylesterase [Mycolicibacterium novocastrense]KUH79860.1 protein-glutamate methylesterase [Mycolicibacterium novocastrense]
MQSTESGQQFPLSVVAVGASAGGVEALTQLVGGMPSDLPCAVLIVLHMPPNAPSVLAKILDRCGPLPVETATDGAVIEPGRGYVCAPDHHLLVADGHVMLSRGPTESGHRPAINALFRSVALSFGPRAIGVLLSGVLDDGVLGAAAIRSRGGVTVVQAPSDALFAAMPLNAIHAGVADHQAAASDIGGIVTKLLEREIEVQDMEPDKAMELENRIAMGRRFSTNIDAEDLGPHSGYICPDCNGSLIEAGPGSYRCRVGHAWTADALLKARDDEIESAIWVALRSLREKAKMSRRLADTVGPGTTQRRYLETAEEADRAATVLGEHLSASPGESGVG